MYKKRCKYCGKEFESPSKGTRYCSPECVEAAQLINKKLSKKRRRARKVYDANKEFMRAMSQAYKLARQVAELYNLPKPVNPNNEPLEIHHLDMNPFNNSPSNLVWLTRSQHEAIHKLLPVVSMLECFKIEGNKVVILENALERVKDGHIKANIAEFLSGIAYED